MKQNTHIFVSPYISRYKQERQWHSEKTSPFPLPLLRLVSNHLRIDPVYAPTPDQGYVEQLAEIDPGLSVHWLGVYDKWGIFLNKKTYLLFNLSLTETCLEVSEEPILIDIIKDRNGDYLPLSPRVLPEINMDTHDMHRYMMQLRDVEYYTQVRLKQKRQEAWHEAHKEGKKILRAMYAPLFGDKANPQVFIPAERKILKPVIADNSISANKKINNIVLN